MSTVSMKKKLVGLAAAAVAMAGLGANAGSPASAAPVAAKGGDSIQYTFKFVNGKTVTGTASSNDTFVAGAGGTSADSPTGMTVHVSCSDPFTGGWGVKAGPVQGVDTAWQIQSYYIVKGSKTCGTPISSTPPSNPKIDIEKYVNGEDADTPPGPTLTLGEKYQYTFKVTNNGDVTINSLVVTDSRDGHIPCQDDVALAPGASRMCDPVSFRATEANSSGNKNHPTTATVVGKAEVAVATSTPPTSGGGKGGKSSSIQYTFKFVNGKTVTGTASSNDTFVAGAGGTSATNPTGMMVHVSCSDPFTGGWGVKLGPVQGVDTAWQIQSFYIVKGSKTCGTPIPNTEIKEVTDSDPAHYNAGAKPPVETYPAIGFQMYVDGQDADDAPGPHYTAGDTVTFTYKATNTGGVTLYNVWVNSMDYGKVSCPKTTLAPGESMWCTPTTDVEVQEGANWTRGKAVGTTDAGFTIEKRDPVNFYGDAS